MKELSSIRETISPVIWQWSDRRLVLDARDTKIAGILNVTKESFSDGGKYWRLEDAVKRGRELEAEGAAFIDLGGQSTRPGFQPLTVEEEIARVLPVLRALLEQVKIPVSVDTDKPEVAEAALAAGAHIINDESGGRPEMAEVIARYGAPVILMHWPREKPAYKKVIHDVAADLKEKVQLYEDLGVKKEHIMIDPGLGFAKNPEENLAVLQELPVLHSLNKPVLIGASRKSFIGLVTGVEEPAQRLAGSLAVTVWSAIWGMQVVRVHDVKETRQAIAMTKAMLPAACKN